MFREVIYLSYLLIQYRMRFEVGAEKSSLWKTLSATIVEKDGEGEAKWVFNSCFCSQSKERTHSRAYDTAPVGEVCLYSLSQSS